MRQRCSLTLLMVDTLDLVRSDAFSVSVLKTFASYTQYTYTQHGAETANCQSSWPPGPVPPAPLPASASA